MKRLVKRLILLCLVSAIAYCGWQAWHIDAFGHTDDGTSADCAIVLGSAAWHNKPSPVFIARLDHAIGLYRDKRVKKLILTGGRGTNAPFAESEVARDYCLKAGIPAGDILIETKSRTTQQNLEQAKTLMETNALRDALIVSDPWHLKRACLMASDLNIPNSQSATTSSRYQSAETKGDFIFREFYLLHHYYLTRAF